MNVNQAIRILADPTSTTSCRACGAVATVHPVNRLTNEGVDTLPPVHICTNTDCGVQVPVG